MIKEKKRKFGLYINLGIEANNFILSGLANKLSENNEVVALVNYDSKLLNNLFNKFNILKIDMKKYNLREQTRNKIENYFLGSRRARLRIKGITPIGWKGNSIEKRAKDYFIGNIIVYKILKLISLKNNTSHYYNHGLASFIKKELITDLVLQSYSAPDVTSLAITANKIGCKIWVINWGWKDFYINEFIPFKIDGLFTWSQKYSRLYSEFNTNLNKEKIHHFGNLGFDDFWNYEHRKRKEFYANKYGFPVAKPIILYPLMNPEVYSNEDKIIEKIIKSYKDSNLDIILLLKPNPMDTNIKRFDYLLNSYDNLFITENMWLYDKENNFNLMTVEAKVEWMDLLYYSDFIISVPSTVTVESLIMKKPVLNIGFGAKKDEDKEILQFANANYYIDLFKRNDVILTNTSADIVKISHKILNTEIKVEEPLDSFLNMNSNATDNVVDIILKG